MRNWERILSNPKFGKETTFCFRTGVCFALFTFYLFYENVLFIHVVNNDDVYHKCDIYSACDKENLIMNFILLYSLQTDKHKSVSVSKNCACCIPGTFAQ